jgi:hypothetical protein
MYKKLNPVFSRGYYALNEFIKFTYSGLSLKEYKWNFIKFEQKSIDTRIDRFYSKPLPDKIVTPYTNMPKDLGSEWNLFFKDYPGNVKQKFEIIEAETRHLKGWLDKNRMAIIDFKDKYEYSRMVSAHYGPKSERQKNHPDLFN